MAPLVEVTPAKVVAAEERVTTAMLLSQVGLPGGSQSGAPLPSGRFERFCIVIAKRNPAPEHAFSARMENAPQRQADQAALEVYLQLRGEGETHERAIQRAILVWLSRCDWVDGRQARIRVTQLLLVTRAMAPRSYEDWVILALGNDLWSEGVPVAVHRLSVHCRALEIAAVESGASVNDFEAVGADVLREYLRTELPRKVSRLRQLAFELMAIERAGVVETR